MLKKHMGIFFSSWLMLLCFAAAPSLAAEAFCGQECHKQPTCREMGYIYNSSECPTGISCPFDFTKKWCKKYTCADGRFLSSIDNIANNNCYEVQYHGLTCYDCLNCSAYPEYNLTSCPPHGICPKCTDTTGTYYKFHDCQEGYRKVESSSGIWGAIECSPKSCKYGTATEASSCGITGSTGWELSEEYDGYAGQMKCKICKPKICDAPYEEGKCPDHATCDNCYSGDEEYYNITKCDIGYVKNVVDGKTICTILTPRPPRPDA